MSRTTCTLGARLDAEVDRQLRSLREARVETTDTDNRRRLKEMLESPDFTCFLMNSISVANTVGLLSIERQAHRNNLFVIEYEPDARSYGIFSEFRWEAETSNEVIDIVSCLQKSVYVDREELKSPSELLKYKEMLSCIMYYWNCDPSCYVCNEDAYGFMTDCKHSICVYCYQKSIQNKKFCCGICRHTVEETSRTV